MLNSIQAYITETWGVIVGMVTRLGLPLDITLLGLILVVLSLAGWFGSRKEQTP